MTGIPTLTSNTKTAQVVKDRNDSRGNYYPVVRNSFGLPAMETCPGKTEFCDRFCYATVAEGRPNVAKAMRRNYELLRNATEDEIYDKLTLSFETYKADKIRYNIPTENDVFRIHWDGDFFSIDYAEAWVRLMHDNPDTQFLVYTRSFREPVNVIPTLYGIHNLSLYISIDSGNAEDALKVLAEFPKLGRAFCAADEFHARQLAENFNKKHAFICPENSGEMPLALNGHGACIECMMCFKKRPDILFVDEKKSRLFDIIPVKIISREERVNDSTIDAGAIATQELVLF